MLLTQTVACAEILVQPQVILSFRGAQLPGSVILVGLGTSTQISNGSRYIFIQGQQSVQRPYAHFESWYRVHPEGIIAP